MGKRSRLVVKSDAMREARLLAGLSPVEVAKSLGVNVKRIYQLEGGSYRGIPPHRAAKLAELLSVALSDITEIEHPQEQAS